MKLTSSLPPRLSDNNRHIHAATSQPPALVPQEAENVHSRHGRSASDGLAPPPDPDAVHDPAQSEKYYLSAWRNSLPRGEALAWLRNAPESQQADYKKRLDQVASSEAELASATQRALAEQPAAAELIQKLRLLHLPGQPGDIHLTATLTEKAGSQSTSVTFTHTLDEAWQAGVLDKMLASADLKVDIRSQRRLLKGEALANFRTGLRGISTPPEVATLNQDQRIRQAFRDLTVSRFELSTLEADMKGELRSNDNIRGLDIVRKFRNGDVGVTAGTLTYNALDASGNAISTPISGWLVLRDSDDNYVLYDADASGRSHHFSSEQAMTQFVSEKALHQTVSTGRLEKAVMAEGAKAPLIWSSRDASLSFMPEENATFDGVMSALADRLQERNTAILGYDASSRDAAVRVINLHGNWERARDQYGMPSLLEYTRTWMQNRDEYGKFLQERGVIGNARDFDPDAFVIRPPSGKNIGTLTEFAAYLRRRESGSADFATNMEILPTAVTDDNYVSALTRTEKTTFADTLSRAVNTPSGAKPATADERYIATLTQESRQALHTAMQMYVRLNQPEVKNGIDQALKAGYPGTDYQQVLSKKNDLTLPESRKLRNAWNMLEVSKMQLALKMAQNSSAQSAEGTLPAGDAQRIERLLAGFPASATSDYDFMAPLTVGNVRVPGMVMFTLNDSQPARTGAEFPPRQYVYTPEAINGRHVFAAGDFDALISQSQAARDTVAQKVALADTNKLDASFEAMLRGSSPQGARAGYAVVDNYDLYSEMVETRIADADEETISRWEMIREVAADAVDGLVLSLAMASGPAAVIVGAGLGVVSLINDGYEAVNEGATGDRGGALVTGALGLLNVVDITGGVKAIGSGLRYAGKKIPRVLKGVAGGAKGRLDRLGLKAFGNMADAAGSAGAAERHSSAFETGWLKRDWAVNVDLSSAQRATPPGNATGDFYALNDRMYIRERGYAGETPMVYEVRAENGGAVRVVNPAHPDVPADKVRWNGNKWVKDSLGLRGGESDAEMQNRLQNMKSDFKKAADKVDACDTKAQEVLKVMQKDKALWDSLKDKVEVRVIKLKDDAPPNSKIVLHPQGEDEPRWLGHYHVYITVMLDNERMVIDPYIGGPLSCANIPEEEFIKLHWSEDTLKAKEYEIKNLAPYTETYKGGNPDDKQDEVTYDLDEFMNNPAIYELDYYPSHEFYYSTK
ncbi:hypothetical protein ACVLVH_004633 [Kluyvera sp. 1366]|jgi:hypothetical protein